MVEEKKKVYEVVEVPTQMGIAIKTPEGEMVSELQLLVRLANELSEVKKAVLG